MNAQRQLKVGDIVVIADGAYRGRHGVVIEIDTTPTGKQYGFTVRIKHQPGAPSEPDGGFFTVHLGPKVGGRFDNVFDVTQRVQTLEEVIKERDELRNRQKDNEAIKKLLEDLENYTDKLDPEICRRLFSNLPQNNPNQALVIVRQRSVEIQSVLDQLEREWEELTEKSGPPECSA